MCPPTTERSQVPTAGMGSCMRRLSSVLTSLSFACSRLRIVCRSTVKRPLLLFFPQMCVKPRKLNVSGFPSPRRFPTVFTAWRAETMHHRAVELVEPRLLKEGRRECPESLSTPFVLPPQEVHELGVDIGVHLLEMPVGVADAEVLTPAPKNRVQR